jgi:hypothetical protein
MAGFGRAYAQRVLNNLLRTVPATPGGWTNVLRPNGLTLHLYTVAPANDGAAGTKPAVGSYAGVAITQADATFGAPTAADPTVVQNAIEFAFPTATADWGTINAWGLEASDGEIVIWDALTTPRTVVNGATAKFDLGSNRLSVSLQ